MDAFFDEYKHLEKLCNDIYGGQNGVSLYIEDMEQTPHSVASLIPGWDSDLKNLKRLRSIRNSIAHDTEGEMRSYEEADIMALKTFYNRIMTQRDPLGLRKNVQKRNKNESLRRAAPLEDTASGEEHIKTDERPVFTGENTEENRSELKFGTGLLLLIGFLVLFFILILVVYVIVTGKTPGEMIASIGVK